MKYFTGENFLNDGNQLLHHFLLLTRPLLSLLGSIIIACIVVLFGLALFIGIALLIFLVHGYLKKGQITV